MELRTLLQEDIEHEREYLYEQEVGSEEYNNSLRRLGTLEDKLFNLDKFESETVSKEQQSKEEKKDKLIKNALEITKIVSGIAIPVFGLIVITAYEKEITYTSAMKGIINCFIPKKTI